jgi:short-subunit dehydrogenase
MQSDPRGGIAIVTGASSGIGASFARRLNAAALGVENYPGLPRFDELWLVARRGDRLETLDGELRSHHTASTMKSGAIAPKIRTFPADLVSDGALVALTVAAKSTGKPVRILVNNAGYGTYGPFSESDLDRQLGQIDLNCRSLTEACGLFDPLLASGSLVINVASLAAFAPLGGFAVYAASKAYVLSFSVALASEWKARGIRVQALCPGSVDSEFALVASEGARTKVLHGWSADRTTAISLRHAGRGKIISLPRFSWQVQKFAAAIVGPVISAVFVQRFLQRPHKAKASA